MSVPQFNYNAGIYLFHWPDEHIKIRLDRLADEHHSVSAEITVITDLPGVAPHLHQARLNLTSTQARRTLKNALSERLDNVDWAAILEQACIITLDKYREGEPVIQVGSLPPRGDNIYRLQPILLEGQANLIYGPGGTGKSYLALYFSLMVQTPFIALGLLPTQGSVLFCDWETSQEEANDRILAIKRGLGQVEASDISYRYCHQGLVDDIAQIQRIVVENNIDMVVIDSVGSALAGEPESADIVLRYFTALRSLRVTTLSIDHTTKDERKSLFGSVYKQNAARSIFELRKSQEPGEDEIHLGLYHRKVNTGKLIAPLGFQLNFETDSVKLKRADIKQIPELAKGLSRKQQLIGLLSHGTMAIPEIAEALETTEGVIKTELYRHKDLFIKIDDQWGLLSK